MGKGLKGKGECYGRVESSHSFVSTRRNRVNHDLYIEAFKILFNSVSICRNMKLYSMLI